MGKRPQVLRGIAYAALLTGAALALLGAMDDTVALPLVGRPEVGAIILVLGGLVLRSLAGRSAPRRGR